MTIEVLTLTGEAFEAALDDVARLRIDVFRHWPYLYDGDMDYERRYLSRYCGSGGAVLVGAFDGAKLIGASTGAPMDEHSDDFGAPFAARGMDLEHIFYCAESVLLPEYRGRGLGHAFFDAREAQARRLGRRYAAFCSVIRPADHPARPADYQPLDVFWRKRGYEPQPGLVAEYSWKDRGQPTETVKELQFWMRAL
ncbi:GNAT family N-acetyltransferase [Defluviimonas sp. WL0002]|uniref:GNAT family N-acetyltransferase n=1 Tax=Albidovulum marisflavi TaxID=2984159 RepID=A0ABT2ZGH4_9RHOB|nr:GNAT family N-acetyltransferase [Defluviimonas sp. WL0002]MCV2870240.1 GNAT family N-acetyltransferase [Defluviimonas sp. WL0002]